MRERGESCEFGYPELWAIMLEKHRPDSGSFPGLPLTLRWGAVGGRAPFTTTRPQQAWLPPSLMAHQAPNTLPSQPRPAQGHSPEENNAHCDQSLQLSRARGIKPGPQGSRKLGRSWQGWAQLCGLASGDAATWLPGNVATHSHPGRSPSWLPGNCSASQPCPASHWLGAGVPESPLPFL